MTIVSTSFSVASLLSNYVLKRCEETIIKEIKIKYKFSLSSLNYLSLPKTLQIMFLWIDAILYII